MIAVHVYRDGIQLLVAACDEELLGNTYTDGKLRLELQPSFYDEMRVDEEGFVRILSGATMANLAGPKTIAAALGANIIDASGVADIDGVPHAQLAMI